MQGKLQVELLEAQLQHVQALLATTEARHAQELERQKDKVSNT